MARSKYLRLLLLLLSLLINQRRVLGIGCYYKLTAKEGTLLTEMDFAPFKPTVCVWEISVDVGFRIMVDIEVFEIVTSCCSCTEDFVEFRDGLNTTSPLIGRYCANNRPHRVFSSGNHLQVEFYSSIRNSKPVNKFRGTYRIICGGVLRASQGRITSPEYPGFSQGQCLFTIVVPFGWVKLTFENFEIGLPSLKQCDSDFVEVKDISFVEYKDSPGSQQLCGEINSKYFYLTSGHELSLLYKSTSPGNRFSATFEAVTNITNKCGGIVTESAAYIYSYCYPLQYPKDTKCEWKVEVSPGYNIELRFLLFNFSKDSRTCDDGKVAIIDGWSETDVQISTNCGHTIPSIIYSRANRLLIRAQSGNTKRTGRFLISYKTVKKKLCPENKFMCVSRECLNRNAVCNGVSDCYDASDEYNCPRPTKRKSLYPLWVIAIFIAFILMGFWLWKTWRKSVHQAITRRRERLSGTCLSAYEDHYNAPLQSGAPPTYSEALLQTDANPPSYEEVVQGDNIPQCTLIDRNNVRYVTAPNGLPPYEGPPQVV